MSRMTLKERDKLVDKLVEEVEKDGMESHELDDQIHDAKSSEAADINNGGLPAQIRYLLETSYDQNQESAERYVRELLYR